jgi:hypothetical protein
MGSESNKTAIDQMFDIIEGLSEYSPENPMLQSLIAAKSRLKDVEKEQIKDSFVDGKLCAKTNNIDSEQYYNEQYGGNK